MTARLRPVEVGGARTAFIEETHEPFGGARFHAIFRRMASSPGSSIWRLRPPSALSIVFASLWFAGCGGSTSLSSHCPPGTYADGATCEPCEAGAYCSGSGAPVECAAIDGFDHDDDPGTECEALTPCASSEWEAAAPSPTADRVCEPQTECLAGEWEVVAPTPTSDRVCGPFTACSPGQYVSEPGTPAADQVCAPCAPGTFSEEIDAPSCAPWTACGPDEVVGDRGSSDRDRRCVPEWFRQYGTSATDLARDAAVDEDGNVVVVGATDGALPGQVAAGDRDAYVRKYDPSGTLLWTRQFGTAARDVAASVVIAPGGDIVVVGTTNGALQGVSAGLRDVFVRRYDPHGEALWTRQFGSAMDDNAASVALDPQGNLLVAGDARAAIAEDPWSGWQDAFVRKYDADGGVLWTRQFGSDESDYAYSVTADAEGNVLVAGETWGVLPDMTGFGWGDAFVRKYDADGGELWTRQFGTDESDFAAVVKVDGQGDVLVAGDTFGVFPGQVSFGSTDSFVRKYSADGEERWTRQLGTAGDEYTYSLSVDGDDTWIVAGMTMGEFPGQTAMGGWDAFAQRRDAEGSPIETRQFGTASDDYLYSVFAGVDGEVLACGDTQGTWPGQSAQGGWDAFVAKLARP